MTVKFPYELYGDFQEEIYVVVSSFVGNKKEKNQQQTRFYALL